MDWRVGKCKRLSYGLFFLSLEFDWLREMCVFLNDLKSVDFISVVLNFVL